MQLCYAQYSSNFTISSFQIFLLERVSRQLTAVCTTRVAVSQTYCLTCNCNAKLRWHILYILYNKTKILYNQNLNDKFDNDKFIFVYD